MHATWGCFQVLSIGRVARNENRFAVLANKRDVCSIVRFSGSNRKFRSIQAGGRGLGLGEKKGHALCTRNHSDGCLAGICGSAAATVIEIAEPREMPSGQVTVDANALLSALEAEGKVAIYGIYFDSGKAEIKPELQAQLEEMGKLMKSQPGLKVFIVGHTDNQGQFDFNVTLSRQRAQAVVDALTKNFGIAAARMIPYGVASVAPVASNAEEAGRAKNRRVELVKQ
jgi:outer membrane protein OmpA-like peptidoglycan-associated protein